MNDDKIKSGIIWLIKLVLVLSSTKNIVYWGYPLLNSGELYHFPVLSILSEIPGPFFMLICGFSLGFSILTLVYSSKRFLGTVLLFCGFTNLILQLSDYLGLHHDMYLSGMAFLGLGGYFLKPNRVNFGLILAITSSTYLLSGIYKINPEFIDGSMAADIIGRSSRFWYGDFFTMFSILAIPISFFAIIVEVVEPFVLIYGNSYLKKISILLTIPFHLGILATGTGTVYNLTYPLLFWFLVYFSPSGSQANLEHNIINKISFVCIRGAILVSVVYMVFLTSMFPAVVNGVIERLL